MADDALTRKDAEMGRLTVKRVEEWREAFMKQYSLIESGGYSYIKERKDLNALCDLALRALSLESVREGALADRLEAMLHQVGHPDYSLKEFYEGVKLIVWELRQSPARVAEQKDIHSTELRK